jgi:RimJ/RimL family protein N-acetyltransferase
MIQSLRAKIINYHRENGTRKLIWKCLITLKNTLFSYKKEVVGCLSVIDTVVHANPKIPVSIRAAEISDLPELKILTVGYKKRDFTQWINDGYIFYIAQLPNSAPGIEALSIPEKSGTKIIGYVCVCPAKKNKHKLVSILKLKDTDYWALDAYIHSEFRGKGINSAIASGFLAQAKREGYTRGYGTILFDNNASRRSYAFIGEKEIGIFTTLTIMGLTFHFLKRNKGNEEWFN